MKQNTALLPFGAPAAGVHLPLAADQGYPGLTVLLVRLLGNPHPDFRPGGRGTHQL